MIHWNDDGEPVNNIFIYLKMEGYSKWMPDYRNWNEDHDGPKSETCIAIDKNMKAPYNVGVYLQNGFNTPYSGFLEWNVGDESDGEDNAVWIRFLNDRFLSINWMDRFKGELRIVEQGLICSDDIRYISVNSI